MGITAISDVHEAVLRAAREKGKSYDEAVKEFLEVSDEVILNRKKEVFDRVVTKGRIKNVESLKKYHDEFVEAYLNAKEKHKIEPKKLLEWIATNLQTC